MEKVLDNFNKNDQRNRGKKPYSNKPGVDDYYRNYVNNYKDNYDYGDDDDKKSKKINIIKLYKIKSRRIKN